MKTKILLSLLALLIPLNSLAQPALLGTALIYQGRLCDGGVPASGYYDFNFKLWDAAREGNHAWSWSTVAWGTA
jgi:hypothetical protein